MHHSDCKLLFEAGKALLVKSGLVCWDEHAFIFAPKYQSNDDTAFENWWKKAFHCEFGRYIAWVLFSVGSENLVKAACLCNGVVPKTPKLKPLGTFVEEHLPKLNISAKKKSDLIEGYRLLKCIRNRDVHDYKANERRLNFTSVESQFVPAFNILAETMKTKHHGGSPVQ